MKLRESEAQNGRLQKDIQRFLAMDPVTLLKQVEIHRSGYANWGILSSIINYLARDINDMFLELMKLLPPDFSDPRYPKFKLGNSLSEKYIYDVQRTLCEDGWLCTKFDDVSHLTVEEQVDYMNNAIQQQEVLGGSQYEVASLATAALILKIGPKNFCDCTKAAATKPPEN